MVRKVSKNVLAPSLDEYVPAFSCSYSGALGAVMIFYDSAICFSGGIQTDSSDETQKLKKDRIPPGTAKLGLKHTQLLW